MSDDLRALVERAKAATDELRDAAREGRVIGFRQRDPLVMAIHAALDAGLLAASRQPVTPEPGPLAAEQVQLLAWAVSNCHTLARRELNRLRPYVTPDTLAIERWEHVQRICEKAGARSNGVLRASLPTEITDGEPAAASAPAEPRETPVSDARCWSHGPKNLRRCTLAEGHTKECIDADGYVWIRPAPPLSETPAVEGLDLEPIKAMEAADAGTQEGP
jgi:hypothetical protein